MCCCQGYWKKIVPFTLALGLGILAFNLLQSFSDNSAKQISLEAAQTRIMNSGSGSNGMDLGSNKTITDEASSSVEVSRLRILSKPRPAYTDEARNNSVQGTVRLRVTFQANGEIGAISVVKGLSYGLNNQAIAAARAIKFIPADSNGQPISVTKLIEYNFTIY